jgi:hypothetical protein
MSGGHFDIHHYQLETLADQIDELVFTNNKKSSDGYSRDYTFQTLYRMKETADALRILANNMYLIDYLVCGDIGEEDLYKDYKCYNEIYEV